MAEPDGFGEDTGLMLTLILSVHCWFPGNPVPDVCIKQYLTVVLSRSSTLCSKEQGRGNSAD